MTWTSLADLVREALSAQRARERDLRDLVSNLPYEDLEKRKQPNRSFAGNAIRTTKYSLMFFVPQNLFEQFHRVANLYFVGLAVLNFVPQVNAFQPEVALIPILVMLALTALKDAWEDLRRYQSDRRLNNTPCSVYSRKEKRFVERRWKDVRVGDFVKVFCNEVVCADLLLLNTSDPSGICHVETANLDGETNLKLRRAVPDLCVSDPAFEPETFTGVVVCERPNSNLNHFKCYVEKPDKVRTGAGVESLLLRGCTVRNTDYTIGFVVYAGHETKSMLNNNGPRYKRSKLERKLNRDVIFCVILLLTMCLIGAVGHFLWRRSLPGVPPYLVPDSSGHLDSPTLSSFYMFFSMIILLQILIPISLYVSIELVKIGQIFFIANDIDLYDEATSSRVQCKALNITEDLGQIEYIFSDKTGTLTENRMVFRRCSILGTEFSHKENAIRLAVVDEPYSEEEVIFQAQHAKTRLSVNLEDCIHEGKEFHSGGQSDSRRPGTAFSSPLETEVIPDRKLLQRTSGAESCCSKKMDPYLDFFLGLAICNTVMVSMETAHRRRVKDRQHSFQSSASSWSDFSSLMNKASSVFQVFSKKPRHRTFSDSSASEEDKFDPPVKVEGSGDGSTDGIQTCSLHAPPQSEVSAGTPSESHYQAESPDEAALVFAAKAYGFALLARTPDSVTVKLPSGNNLVFEVMDTLTFDSNRKRMSVLVRHPMTMEYVLYTKGADSSIMELLGTPNPDQREMIKATQHHLDCYAKEGLRTLCFTKKVMSEKEYEIWSSERKTALAAIEGREELMMESAVKMETNLTLLGATGIEDRLQEDVPETIVALREAGIQVWVLTGDKPETAVNIGYTCRLLHDEDLVINMSCKDKLSCTSILNCTLEEVRRFASDPHNVDTTQNISLVIDGPTLAMALGPDLQERFVALARSCRSVLCCRVTPLQKSAVVKVMREKLKVMTLAVGDGANDVNMIQAADVGVGITGQEGMQAVMASDFAISRFKDLQKLLLLHGHWCYTRLANMIIYFFYKNVAYVNMLFWYQFFCGFSAASMLDYWMLIFFNLFFTSTPPIMFGIMDQDVSADMLLGVPELYRTGQGEGVYRCSTFWGSMLDAFYQSLVCFFIPYLAYQDSDIDVFTFGTQLNTISLFIILLHLSIEIKSWTLIHWLCMLGSVALYFTATLLYSTLCVTCNPPSNPYWVIQVLFADPLSYLICFITTVVALLPRYLFHVLRNSLTPSPLVQARHLDRLDPESREEWMEEWRSLRGGGGGGGGGEEVGFSEPPGQEIFADDEFALNVLTDNQTSAE